MGLSTPHHKIGLSTTLLRRVCIPYKILINFVDQIKFFNFNHADYIFIIWFITKKQ